MWKVEAVNKGTYNCFQFIVATMAKFFCCEYHMVMLELWGFKYNIKINGNIGSRLGLCWAGEIDRRKELLQRYHGLQLSITELDGEVILESINKKLTTGPLSVYLDSYECYWLPFYKKQHRLHTVILTDKGSDTYSFIDQYSDTSLNSELEFTFIETNCKQVVEFNYYPAGIVQDEYLLEIINCINIFERRDTLKNFKAFSQDMKNELSISNEITDNDPIASKLVMYLKNLTDDRINLIEAVGYIESKTGISLGNSKELLYAIAQKYDMLRSYIIKCAFTKRNPDKDRISSKIDEIYESEENILNCFKRNVT